MKLKKEWKIRVVSKYHKTDLSICGIFLLKECKDSEECDDNIMLLLQSASYTAYEAGYTLHTAEISYH